MNKQQAIITIENIMNNSNKAYETLLEIMNNSRALILNVLEQVEDTPPEGIPEYLSYDQASAFLSIPKGTLQQKVSQRKIPYHKFGGSVRFKRDELVEWGASSRIRSDREAILAGGVL